MSLRAQLLLVGLVLLLLPIAGWQLLGRLETVVRQSEEQALLAVTQGLAGPLQSLAETRALPASEQVLYVRPMGFELVPDGYADEWQTTARYGRRFQSKGLIANLQLGSFGSQLALWLQVDDATVVWGDAAPTPPVIDDTYAIPDDAAPLRADHVVVELRTATESARFRFSSASAGPVRGVPMGSSGTIAPPMGVWQRREDAPGYQLEIVVARGERIESLGLRVADYVSPASARASLLVGTLRSGDRLVSLPLLRYSPDISKRLQVLTPIGSQLWLAHSQGWVVGGARSADTVAAASQPSWVWALVYRWFLASSFAEPEWRDERSFKLGGEEIETAGKGQSSTAWRPAMTEYQVVASAASPVKDHYVVLLQRPNAALQQLVEAGVGGLILTTLLAAALAGVVLLGYASWLSLRIRRLAEAAEAAAQQPDRVSAFPSSSASDEIGGLSRSFSALLGELHSHNAYLQTLADKLSHELHTPLAVVRSSLENLGQHSLPPEVRAYTERAEGGVHRLATILRAMSEASRLERSIEDADSEDFDLREVIEGCLEGYRGVHGADQFDLQITVAAAPMTGAPELVAQMLDKLVDNAISFSPADKPVSISVGAVEQAWQIQISNEGPPLPDELEDRLFESMVSKRSDSTGAHFGMGLYIVRLITRYHSGEVTASNLPANKGVQVRVTLPSAE